MHLLVRETHSIDETQAAVDLDHAPADIVFLTFSDSDLASLAAAWQAMEGAPTLRLANLGRLRHPMSVDLYIEKTLSHARFVLIRLLGGLDYWRYGAEEVAACCRAGGIKLAIIPGCERDDPRLTELSTLEPASLDRLRTYFRQGGADNMRLVLQACATSGETLPPPCDLPAYGRYAQADRDLPGVPSAAMHPHAQTAAIVLYRAHVLADDTAPILALADALLANGLAVRAFYVDSLKNPNAAAAIADALRRLQPAIVITTTCFGARQNAGRVGARQDAGRVGARQDAGRVGARQNAEASPLDAAGVPVLQAVLANPSREAWLASPRGLGQTDLAMNVVLPELDGRLLAGAISFKAHEPVRPGLEHARTVHQPNPSGIDMTARRAAGWARLAATPPCERNLGILLADYPGVPGQRGHAVGLDTFASLAVILRALHDAGYATGSTLPGATDLAHLLCDAAPTPTVSLAQYSDAFAKLAEPMRASVIAAWGPPEADPDLSGAHFTHRLLQLGRLRIAVQPDRGNTLDRKTTYHDPDLPPRHGYIAFHLWLTMIEPADALIGLGAHGTLEWLPGKAVALSDACFPAVLLGGTPMIYPFIVNDPGEAAAAKRRLGAVIVGHLTPATTDAGLHGEAARLERMIDEYAAADGLDRRRTKLLRQSILDLAQSLGLATEAGIASSADDEDALQRLSAYLCDVKDLRIRNGLHVFGQPPTPEQRDGMLGCLGAEAAQALDASPDAERVALLAALDGRFIEPGPAGAPTRGRVDVLPTGRNLFSVDPRAIPTSAATSLARTAAAELLRRHRQEQGDHLRRIVIDLWGSTTMRTGGEDIALALTLMGVSTLWDPNSARVCGFEIIPLALLDRPRVDVTLRISGLFRDAFALQIDLLDQAVAAIAARDEAADWNALAAACAHGDMPPPRIFGPAPGTYGASVAALTDRGAWKSAAELGQAYLDAASFAYGSDREGTPDAAGFAASVASADAYLHIQDHAETDLLDGTEQAAHLGGFAAAAGQAGMRPRLYHADTSRPEAPRLRLAREEVARVARGRVANPRWIAGMTRHGYRGGAEIARCLDALFIVAATLPDRFDDQFDLVYAATLGDDTTERFLRAVNPEARAAMAARFAEARRRDLWRTRSNTAANELAGAA